VHLANDSAYGLSGAIYTRNLKRGVTLGQQIDSGDVNINRPSAIWGAVAAPMGGQKDSGIDRRNGPEGLLRFVRTQSIVLDRVPRAIIPPDLAYFTPRLRWLIALRRRLMPYLPFLRP
jgi:succinate-semialdehyde dehydrogenase/glutarate-semialdehyde dehydrogenase